MPSNVRILTLERWNANEILLRLEHIFQLNEHPVYSQPATVEISVGI